jgi:hypothetical protein
MGQYTVIIPTRDLIVKHAEHYQYIQMSSYWKGALVTLLSERDREPEMDPDTARHILMYYWEDHADGGELPPLCEEGWRFMSVWISELYNRIQERWAACIINIPKGYVYEMRLNGWISYDLVLEFLFTASSYTVPHGY